MDGWLADGTGSHLRFLFKLAHYTVWFLFAPQNSLCAPHGLPIPTARALVNTPQPGPSCVVVVVQKHPTRAIIILIITY